MCLHIHSEYSHDSDVPVKEIIQTAKTLGYDAISITDHNTARGSMEALQYSDEQISIIPGAEFSTQYGHILAYFIDESIEKETPKLDGKRFDFYKLIENVRKQNGILVMAHPYNGKLKDHMEVLDYLDGIERYNARLDSFFYKTKSDRFVKTLLNRKGFIYLGGPDAHSLKELSHCYTATEDFTVEPKAFKEVLQNKSVIYYKNSVNYNIAKAKFHNMKGFKPKSMLKNGVRMLFGIIEIVYNKITRCKEYETICIGKEN